MTTDAIRSLVLAVLDDSADIRDSRRLWLSPGESLTVGRTEVSDLSLPADDRISGRHMRVECETFRCRLYDLESTNGTYLNGKQVAKADLADGDEIIIGRTRILVHIDGGRGRGGGEPGEGLSFVAPEEEAPAQEAPLKDSHPTLAELMASLG